MRFDSFICFMKSCLPKSALQQENEFDIPSISLSFRAAVLYLRLASNCFHLKKSFWKSLKNLRSPGLFSDSSGQQGLVKGGLGLNEEDVRPNLREYLTNIFPDVDVVPLQNDFV